MPLLLPRPNADPLLLDLRPLPLGFQQQLKRHGLVAPSPPARLARDSSGKPLKDGQGQPLRLFDETDPAYQDACERHHQRVAVLAVAFALKHDPHSPLSRTWPVNEPPPAGDWDTWADDLFETLVDAGWLAGDLIATCEEISGISNLVSDRLLVAQHSFSAPKETTS